MGKKLVCVLFAVVTLGPAVANAAGLTPVGWWPFDEKTATGAADLSAASVAFSHSQRLTVRCAAS